MAANKNYQLGLLHLVHLLISADGVIDEKERNAILRIKNKENIPDSIYTEFENEVKTKREKDIYQQGIALINECTDEEKLNAFVHLYKLSEVDGNVHVKEVRLLLYSIKMAGIEFNDVIQRAAQQA
jgi:uncharacterized tellurite resistance protein B-like protein